MPFVVWWRRGSGRWLAPPLLGFLVVSLLASPGWQVELDWATRLTAASVLVVCPVVAAAAAFDTSRRFRPTLALLAQGSVRRRGHVALPAVAVVAWAVAAYLATWLLAAVLVVRGGGVGPTDFWVFPEIVVPLVAAGGAGLAVGTLTSARVAAPVAVAVVLAGTVVAVAWGDGPFQAQTTYGTLTGLERTDVRAAAAVLGAFVVGLAAFLAASEGHRLRGPRRVVLAVCVVSAVAASVVPAALPWKQQVFAATTEPYGCIGSRPAVCAPESRLGVVGPAQESLAAAYTTLEGTVFVEPAAFRVTRIDHYADLDGAAPLDFDPVDVREGTYDPHAVARALVRPHQCIELFTASTAQPLLEAQDVVLPWLTGVLSGRQRADPVPAEVSAAFSRIQECRPMTWDRQ